MNVKRKSPRVGRLDRRNIPDLLHPGPDQIPQNIEGYHSGFCRRKR
jgi:hypothetical protein